MNRKKKIEWYEMFGWLLLYVLCILMILRILGII